MAKSNFYSTTSSSNFFSSSHVYKELYSLTIFIRAQLLAEAATSDAQEVPLIDAL